MSGPGRIPPPGDQALGLEFYVTDTPGVPIAIKQAPEDFEVRELSAYPWPQDDGRFVVLRVESRNWEQHELAQRLAASLHVPMQQVRWAGTKDRRAVAERLVSYLGPLPSPDWALPGVRILEAYRARDGLVLGHHYGNAFRVRLTVLDATRPIRPGAAATLDQLRRLGGFANLFGPQRFGEVRPITHLVGQALVRGQVDEAVRVYLEECPAPGPSFGDEARLAYAAHHDPRRALREFPGPFRFERRILEHLAQGHDAARALRALPRSLRSLFVHAYQAWLFNRWLSARFAEGLSLDRPTDGDHLLRVARDGTVPGTHPVRVEPDNVVECRAWAERGGVRVAGPLVGLGTPLLEGEPGRLFDGILASEGVRRDDFALRAAPDIASEGTWRPTWCPLPPVAVASAESDGRPSDGVWLSFALPKGVYATILLREISKGAGVGLPVERP